LLSKKVKKRR